jgi:hypothetical protein
MRLRRSPYAVDPVSSNVGSFPARAYDWSVSDGIHLDQIGIFGKGQGMERFINKFLESDFFVDGSNYQISHMLKLLQASIRSLVIDRNNLEKRLSKANSRIQYLADEIAKMRQPDVSVVVSSCPVCQEGFGSIGELDSHVKSCHPSATVESVNFGVTAAELLTEKRKIERESEITLKKRQELADWIKIEFGELDPDLLEVGPSSQREHGDKSAYLSWSIP